MSAFVVAIEGAESTGKSTLAADLEGRLSAQGRRVVRVDEVLRRFSLEQGRTPRCDEQAALARQQAQAIDTARARADIVVADTTGLMTAVYSEVIFDDRSLYADIWPLRHADLTLVTGLDLPWVADGILRDGPAVQARVDAALRAALAARGQSYSVIYGRGPERLRAAGCALAAAGLMADPAPDAGTDAGRRWRRVCLDCIDPECEHLLPRTEAGASPGRQ